MTAAESVTEEDDDEKEVRCKWTEENKTFRYYECELSVPR